MSKDVIYSMRMSRSVREALNKLAKKEHRTVASLLDKIIIGYLENNGGSVTDSDGSEKRWYTRKVINREGVATTPNDMGSAELSCGIVDISTAGVLISYPRRTLMNTDRFCLPDFRLSVPFSGEEDILIDCEGRRMLVSQDNVKLGAVFKNSDRATLESIMKNIKIN